VPQLADFKRGEASGLCLIESFRPPFFVEFAPALWAPNSFKVGTLVDELD
jgi:hypothetical protein